jgi:hypothetical protein
MVVAELVLNLRHLRPPGCLETPPIPRYARGSFECDSAHCDRSIGGQSRSLSPAIRNSAVVEIASAPRTACTRTSFEHRLRWVQKVDSSHGSGFHGFHGFRNFCQRGIYDGCEHKCG